MTKKQILSMTKLFFKYGKSYENVNTVVLENQINPDSLLKAAQIKKNLGQYEEANLLFSIALKILENNAESHYLLNAAEIKKHFHEYVEADVLYSKVLKYHFTTKNSLDAAFVKSQLKKYEEADVLYSILLNEDKFHFIEAKFHLIEAALVKYQLQKFDEAEILLDKLCLVVLQSLSKEDKPLKNETSAEKVDSISLYCPSPIYLHCFGDLKFQQKKYEEADLLYDALFEKDPKPPIDAFKTTIVIKHHLQNYIEADKFADKLVDSYSEEECETLLIPEFMMIIAEIKYFLEKMEQAEYMIDQVLEKEKSAKALLLASNIKFKAKKYEESQELFDQISNPL